jgi:hypothetical protein
MPQSHLVGRTHCLLTNNHSHPEDLPTISPGVRPATTTTTRPLTPLRHCCQVVILPRQLPLVNLTPDDAAGPLPLSLLTYISQVPARKALALRCDAGQCICWQVVRILLQDRCAAGLIRQAKMDGQVKPGDKQTQQKVLSKYSLLMRTDRVLQSWVYKVLSC